MTSHGKPQQATASHGKPWQATANHGKPWQTKPLQATANRDKPWQTAASHGKPWPAMASHGKPWPATGSHGTTSHGSTPLVSIKIRIVIDAKFKAMCHKAPDAFGARLPPELPQPGDIPFATKRGICQSRRRTSADFRVVDKSQSRQ
jgi:hypothetical protein